MLQPDYTAYARFYDYFELAGCEESEELNLFLDELFSANAVKSVADIACGTGAQSLGLAKAGYQVKASDICQAMLEIAKEKAGALPIAFRRADMQKVRLNKEDAVICIFNSIGHLTPDECGLFFKHIAAQLKPGAIFVFDILNRTAMQGETFKEYESMSREAIIDKMLVQHSRTCEFNRNSGIITTESFTRWQDGKSKPGELHDRWQMQTYSAEDIERMLDEAGFTDRVFFGPTGTEFVAELSDSILAVCEK